MRCVSTVDTNTTYYNVKSEWRDQTEQLVQIIYTHVRTAHTKGVCVQCAGRQSDRKIIRSEWFCCLPLSVCCVAYVCVYENVERSHCGVNSRRCWSQLAVKWSEKRPFDKKTRLIYINRQDNTEDIHNNTDKWWASEYRHRHTAPNTTSTEVSN